MFITKLSSSVFLNGNDRFVIFPKLFTDLSANFTWGATSTTEVSWSNDIAYRYIYLRGVSGSTSSSPWQETLDFKTKPGTETYNASGSFEGATITAGSSTSKMGAVITYQDNAGTNYNVTDASYDPGTGVLELTIPGHSLTTSNTLKVLPDKLKFTCNEDGNVSIHTYPRSTDPAHNSLRTITAVTTNTVTINVGTALKRTYPRVGDPAQNKWLTISNVGATTFQVNVGISSNKSTHTCTAVSGVITERDFPSGRSVSYTHLTLPTSDLV